MNPKLSAISTEAAANLTAFIEEKEDEILKAWDAAVVEAQDQEAKPKFRLGFTITLDLDRDSMETALAWSVRHKVSREQTIPDPEQLELQT